MRTHSPLPMFGADIESVYIQSNAYLLLRPMHVQIVLESPLSTWTNLDVLRGKVILRLFSATPLSFISVKLEGESRTRIKAPLVGVSDQVPGGWNDSTFREEAHKILYRKEIVLPRDNLDKGPPPSARVITLAPGSYEFPFQFKIPFNNACRDATPSAISTLAQAARSGRKGAPIAVHHVKQTLPPALTTFPGLAEIRYYIKATVSRKEFYKENPRVYQQLNFLPIEPPRKPSTGAESYARRQHQFEAASAAGGSKGKSRLLGPFRKAAPAQKTDPEQPTEAPLISVDARLSAPAILTCNEDIPMRVIVKRLNTSREPLFLQSLHVQLHGITRIKANELRQDESSNWVVLSKSNMGFLLSNASTSTGGSEKAPEIVLDPGLWRNHPLPNSVSPTFETCNISRKYELEIQIGVSCGSSKTSNSVILPLRLQVDVYSGIAPPAALLAAIASQRVPPRKPSASTAAVRPEKSSAFSAPLHLQTGAASSSSAIPTPPIHTPVEPQGPQFGPLPAGEEAPPPSYEDAIASDMPAIQGPRRVYQQPPIAPGAGFSDEKGRRDS